MKSDRTSQKISYSTANRRGKKIQAIFRASKALGRPKKTFKAFWMARIPMAGAKFFLDQKLLLHLPEYNHHFQKFKAVTSTYTVGKTVKF